jgi:capsular exopolysaccharide synthesis family protein
MAVSLIFSATGGTILAMVLERRDASVRSTSQIREVTSTRVLGAIPTVKRARRKRLSPQAQVLSKRRSLFVENLRGVWLQIYSSRETPGNIVLITSSVSGEGKSSVAACLARMLAQAGRRTAILDGDLRNPSVHRALGLSRLPGLAELVVDEASLYDVLQVDEASGAYCITAGAAVASPSDLLQTARLAQVLRELSAEFDVVIIDSPPILAVHDALILAKQADVTIMVVRWGKTRITAICTALQRMFDLSIPVEGIVLTMVDSRQYRLYGFSDAEIFSPGLRKYYHD